MSILHLAPRDIGTIYCVGRNYAEHANELNNPIPAAPVIFTKARASVCPLAGQIVIPARFGRCDHETEIVIRLGKDLSAAEGLVEGLEEGTAGMADTTIIGAISHYGLGLDLTLRDKQTELKQQKYPWDLAKSFFNSSPIGGLIPFEAEQLALDNIGFSLLINGEVRQQGNSQQMLFSIVELIRFISRQLPLLAGDLIFTGTPAGVGPLDDGDELSLVLNGQTTAGAKIVRPVTRE